ncbi:MAG: DASH family cryptochrome [Flammeovirgaceae bacterium]|nr:DASH family cryptochrome [Flammeovirgaceae bacterium]MDW8286438.1 DASH family cryptochrome [Flammeovirgaceae bacterium]
MNPSVIVVWLRNDLRLHDNEMLWKATQRKDTTVVPVYCFDENQFKIISPLNIKKTEHFRAKFLIEGVTQLRKKIRALGGELIVRFGNPAKEIAKIAIDLKASAVFTSKEITSEEVALEKALEALLQKTGIEVRYFWQSTLYHLEDLPFPIQALPDVFTQFRKEIERSGKVRPLFPTCTTFSPPVEITSGEIPTLSQLGLTEVLPTEKHQFVFVGGEDAGIARLNEYFWEKDLLKNYKETRNGLLGADYASRLSAWLSLGFLSPRYVYQQVKAYEAERITNESTYWLVFELLWRDYFKFVAKKHGNKIFLKGGIRNVSIDFTSQTELFWKWANGQTGIPFIDANMLELKQTGFMSNRGRQNVASFLVKDLRIDWRWGASYFESMLIDYDVCSNWGNWNYIAGIGNDPRENRYFNILSQAQRYDAKGEYVKHWIDVLKKVPSRYVHQVGNLTPQQLKEFGIRLGIDYPKPIVKFSLNKT